MIFFDAMEAGSIPKLFFLITASARRMKNPQCACAEVERAVIGVEYRLY